MPKTPAPRHQLKGVHRPTRQLPPIHFTVVTRHHNVTPQPPQTSQKRPMLQVAELETVPRPRPTRGKHVRRITIHQDISPHPQPPKKRQTISHQQAKPGDPIARQSEARRTRSHHANFNEGRRRPLSIATAAELAGNGEHRSFIQIHADVHQSRQLPTQHRTRPQERLDVHIMRRHQINQTLEGPATVLPPHISHHLATSHKPARTSRPNPPTPTDPHAKPREGGPSPHPSHTQTPCTTPLLPP